MCMGMIEVDPVTQGVWGDVELENTCKKVRNNIEVSVHVAESRRSRLVREPHGVVWPVGRLAGAAGPNVEPCGGQGIADHRKSRPRGMSERVSRANGNERAKGGGGGGRGDELVRGTLLRLFFHCS